MSTLERSRRRISKRVEESTCSLNIQGWEGRDTVSVHDSPSPKGHAQRQVDKREVKTKLRGFFDGNDRR